VYWSGYPKKRNINSLNFGHVFVFIATLGRIISRLDGRLFGLSKALRKGLYSRRDCIRQHLNFPAVLRAWLKTKDVRFTQWPDVAFSTIGEGIYQPFFYLLFRRFLQKTYGQPISHISVVFVYVPNFCMAR